ncbi:SRPBCC family protein [Streptomyces sp. NPDC088400]|uniref:SRPBCC family protein n=1 Tax=Streptomyces sp. NPDC088400 TaxID=3365861 RepID=UPI003829994F
MADSTLGRIKDEVAKNPATDRLKEELRNYLQARAQHAVTGLGYKLGESVSKLAEPGRGPGGLVSGLAPGGKALGEGRTPGQAALAVGASRLKDTVKDKVKDKVKGLFGKGRRGGGGKSRSVTIVEDIDVGVPVREAYDQWTQFQEFSTFAKGVVSVEKADDTSSNWKVKVAKSTRSWKANVTEQVPDERITWTTEGAKGTVKGVVTFHPITDTLTRVLLVLEYFPKGLFEKTGNVWRAQGRRARLDLKLYRTFIMMRGEATDGWRGEIQDGEVVLGHEEAVEQEQELERAEEGVDRDPEEIDGNEEFHDADADADLDADSDVDEEADSDDEFVDRHDDVDEEDEYYEDEYGVEDEPDPEIEVDGDTRFDEAAEPAENAENAEDEEPVHERPARRPRRRTASARR